MKHLGSFKMHHMKAEPFCLWNTGSHYLTAKPFSCIFIKIILEVNSSLLLQFIRVYQLSLLYFPPCFVFLDTFGRTCGLVNVTQNVCYASCYCICLMVPGRVTPRPAVKLSFLKMGFPGAWLRPAHWTGRSLDATMSQIAPVHEREDFWWV